jgi:hypothetical protein
MNDLITKATFGFLMAQLFPGAVIVFSINFVYFAFGTQAPCGLLATADHVLTLWSSASVAQQLFLLALCVGAGMFVHGLHWAVFGYLENKAEDGRLFRAYWKDYSLGLQVLTEPFHLTIKTVEPFLRAKSIRDMVLEENVPNIHKDHMKQFEFIEDFYLYSAQFFCHTAYSLLAVVAAVTAFGILYGPTWRRFVLWLLSYFLCGVFSLLGHIQLGSLFAAESDLVRRSGWTSVGVGGPSSETD